MKKVRAKFTCHHIEEQVGYKTANLMAVYGQEGDNKDYSEATPSGELRIQIDNNRPAADFFEIGQDYYLDFSKA